MAAKNVLTISDVARMGARAQLKKYGRKQLREWGKLGGRPRKEARPTHQPKPVWRPLDSHSRENSAGTATTATPSFQR